MRLPRLGQVPDDASVVSTSSSPSAAQSQDPSTPLYSSPLRAVTNSYIVPAQSNFAKFMLSRPGQPYMLNLKPADVEKALYKDIPTSVPEKDELAKQGADPQQVAQLQNGLEVPIYLLNRESARRKATEVNEAILAAIPAPSFFFVGEYSMRYPVKAAAMALALGLVIGKLTRSKK